MPTTHIIIVNYNGIGDLHECLRSLSELESSDWHVWIVDNCSPELGADPRNHPLLLELHSFAQNIGFEFNSYCEGAEFAPPHNRAISFILRSENLGFAKSNNFGAKLASLDVECKFFWFLNPDVHVTSLAERNLRKDLNSGSKNVVGSLLLDWPSNDQFMPKEGIVQAAWVRFNSYNTKAIHVATGQKYSSLAEIPQPLYVDDYVVGASFMIRSDVFFEVGGLSEDYFLYFEELDLNHKIFNIGGRVRVSLDSIVFHKEGASAGSSRQLPGKISSYHMSRSLVIFYRKHYPYLLMVALARCVFNALREAVLRRRVSVARAVLGGMVSGLWIG